MACNGFRRAAALRLACLALCALAALAERNPMDEGPNMRPVIGVMAQPSDGPIQSLGPQYISASYVKFLESAGARVLPVRYDLSFADLETVFNNINGLLIPGGAADLNKSPFYFTLEYLFKLAIKENKAGSYFPVWGTCNGFEALTVIVGQDYGVLTQYDAENYTVPLQLAGAAKGSRLLRYAPPEVVEDLATLPITMNNHHFGVHPDDWAANGRLAEFFDIVSTNVDRAGRTFISTIEAKQFPVYGVQWHPEKPQFEWDPLEVIDHSGPSVRASQYIANFIVSEARRSLHQLDPKLQGQLIYAHSPVYVQDRLRYFQQAYFFDSATYNPAGRVLPAGPDARAPPSRLRGSKHPDPAAGPLVV
eukprot:tig00020911_g15742.t1